MPRKLSAIAPDWWDYTTLDASLIDEAARLTPRDLQQLVAARVSGRAVRHARGFLSRRGARIHRRVAAEHRTIPVGICGPIGPTEQLPLVARLVNRSASTCARGHFWGMDEWFDAATGREVPVTHPLSFERADRELCFNRIRREAADAGREPALSQGRHCATTVRSWDAGVRCAVMQGGQGDVKHWAFNDPLPRKGTLQGRTAAAGRISQAGDARRRSASADHRAERPHQRRRQHLARADEGDHRRAGGNLEGGEGFDLARGQARQSVRPAAHRA